MFECQVSERERFQVLCFPLVMNVPELEWGREATELRGQLVSGQSPRMQAGLGSGEDMGVRWPGEW